MLKITQLDHVGLTVSDMDKSLDFYRRLGLEVLRTSGPDAKGVRSAVVKVASQELNIFSRPDVVPGASADNAVGMHHFCLRMEAASVEELIAGVRAAGLDIVRGPIKRRDGTSLFLADPDGVRVELQLFD
jgi:catechol 2,3-dioxygenase-like lactoylglutathione lyase family enzyme